MAVTLTNVRRIVAGNSVRIVGSVTGPASYTTGGETLSAAQISTLTDGDSTTALTANLTFDSEVVPTSFRAMVLDRTNKKLLFTTAFAEVASTTNLSAVSINFESIVRTSNTGAGKTVA
jgi:hypothetical protein